MEAIKAKDEKYLYVLIVILSVYRFSYYGFIYTPYLDDYVQYSYYPSLPEHWQRVYVGGTGVLFSRPLAGILDLVLCGSFYIGYFARDIGNIVLQSISTFKRKNGSNVFCILRIFTYKY